MTRTSSNTRLLLALIAAVGALAVVPPVSSAAECPNEQGRRESNVNPTTGEPYDLSLPECRAYEMVSPLEKQAHDADLYYKSFDPSLDGVIGFSSQGDFLDPNGFEVGVTQNNAYISRRTTGGWETSSSWAPSNVIAGQAAPDFTPDLASESRCGNAGQDSVLSGNVGITCARRDPFGAWTPTPAYRSLNGIHPDATYNGASSDLSTLVFQLNPDTLLLPDDTYTSERGGSIYEMTGVGGPSPQLKLVNVTNSGESLGAVGTHVSVGYTPIGEPGDAYQAISESGNTIFFTVTPTSGGVPTLYARVGGAETVAISDPVPPECTTCNPTVREAIFQGASADGSKGFFTTEQPLLNGDEDETGDLYEYDFNRPTPRHLVQLSRGGPGDLTPGVGANVQGVVLTSHDGSRVYFVATGVLTTLPNANGQVARPGAENLYVVDTNTEETNFVADLCSGSEQSGFQADAACPASPTTVDFALWSTEKGQAQTTPDGRYLTFSTVARLTPDDVNSAQDVYRYDSQTGEVVRVSIGEPSYPASNDNNTGANAEITEPNVHQSLGGAFADVNDTNRSITSDGSEIVFLTSASLQANDVNAASEPSSCKFIATSPGCDVYLWHDGVVSMISGGRESAGHQSNGISGAVISPSGSDIYLATGAQLVGQDTDRLADVYDARLNGGFPAPVAPPSCTGEEWTCQGNGSHQPAPSSAQGSATQPPGGNLTPASFVETEEPAAKPKRLTKAQKLAAALKACRKKPRSRRAFCERQARKKYAPAKKRKK